MSRRLLVRRVLLSVDESKPKCGRIRSLSKRVEALVRRPNIIEMQLSIECLHPQPPITFSSLYQLFIEGLCEANIFKWSLHFHNRPLLVHAIIFKYLILPPLISASVTWRRREYFCHLRNGWWQSICPSRFWMKYWMIDRWFIKTKNPWLLYLKLKVCNIIFNWPIIYDFFVNFS